MRCHADSVDDCDEPQGARILTDVRSQCAVSDALSSIGLFSASLCFFSLLPAAFQRHGCDVETNVEVAWVPGSFELPVVAKSMASTGKVSVFHT